ncbi:hypothetical protein SAMN04488074_11635 [Lentzea albidocapillata subsp. violacea]|uniref:Uncharacterized protein n=1 Tax=Lentzea albidocapillata subsp. violacea TaxID=128104 RepID=A0A1G9Q5E9_9PSEU|nr:hypothetical protein [Lentzea albidocapillata]SDM06272.1 hypothetical protein SAMN04488074_11635 [Lentzea albidocapillata subsp. violacea]
MYARLTNLRFWLLVFPIGWLAMVFVFIAVWPDPGAASPDELASEVTNALRAHDFHQLEPLLAVGGEDVAQSTVDQFETARVDRGVYRDGAVVVEYTVDGVRAEFRLPVEIRDGRYVVNPVVTPRG